MEMVVRMPRNVGIVTEENVLEGERDAQRKFCDDHEGKFTMLLPANVKHKCLVSGLTS